jgi:hypothetical protein
VSVRRRAAVLAAFAFIPLLASAAPAAPREPAHRDAQAQSLAALRVASLAERIAKLQAQAGQGVLAERAKRSLAQSLRQLDAAMRELGRPAAPAELHESVAILQILAREYRTWALKPATRDSARGLGERCDEVAWTAAKAARLFAPGETTPAARAERAAALGQQAARFALWRQWHVGGSVGNEIALAAAQLRADIDALHMSPATPETDAELQVADNQAAFLFAALRESETDARALETAAKASDNMQESMERLARVYAER